jgi:ABC-type multidrug transport system fused ATPase/permease subunit
MPELTTMAIDAYVSSKRIQSYLLAPEISGNTTDSLSISFEDASIAWPSDEEKVDGDERYVLRNINANFPDKELSVITGNTGSGKSLFLASILGESDLLKGRINVPKPPPIFDRHDQKATEGNWLIPNSISFVAQIPWIENASIKDNILFGLPFDEYRYNKTLEVCALGKDLEMMPDGDETEIGAQGINLSGGQRWRVTFARALYSRAGILILDDILSAVDATTGRFIFEQGLTGELGVGRTRILVTHHIALCKSRSKYLIELGDGTVEHAGFLSELEQDGTLTNIISHDENAKKAQEDEDATVVHSEVSSDHRETLNNVNSKTVAKKFVEEERREKGAISKAIYWKYIQSFGGFSFWTVALLLFLSQQAVTVGTCEKTVLGDLERISTYFYVSLIADLLFLGRSWWLKLWTGSYEEAGIQSILTYAFQMPLEANALPPIGDALTYYLTIYIGISVASSILAAVKFLCLFIGSLRASKLLFEGLTFTVLRTPLRWVDTTPTSRILNRFIADFNVVDSRLAFDMGFTTNSALQLVGVIIAGSANCDTGYIVFR